MNQILDFQNKNNKNWMDGKEKKPNIYFMKAKFEVDDEFYTSYHEIKEEMEDYGEYFKNKIIICPCNDGYRSNFYRYFNTNFKKLELKKLITTTFNLNDPKAKGTKIEVTENKTTETELQGRGDFRSSEVKKLIKQADIIVTNPPFSLFRDIIEIAIEKNKQFLIVGGTYSITYKKIFELYKQGKIWLGNNQVQIFTRPNGTKKRFSNISWFTNLKSIKHFIEVTNYKNIPIDYYGVIGVPLTFFLRHNPAQFNILGCDFEIKDLYPELVKWDYKENNTRSAVLNGQEMFTRIIIQRKNGLKPRAILKNQI